MSAAGHRAGPFKQQNKQHKTGRHRSKGLIDSDNRGRKGPKEVKGKKVRRELWRVARRNQSRQLRAVKREALWAQKRLGRAGTPPILTTIVSLSGEVDCCHLLQLLSRSDQEAVCTSCQRSVHYLAVKRFKCRYGFVIPDVHRLDFVLDAIKVSDVLMLVWPNTGQLEDWANLLLSAILAHGLPTPIHIVCNFSQFNSKNREIARKNVNKLLSKWSFNDKFYLADTESDALVVLRQINGCKKRQMSIQKFRPHLLVEQVDISEEVTDGKCDVKVKGYLRGPPLDVNSLVNVPGLGHFQLRQIDLLPDPHPLPDSIHKTAANIEIGIKVLAVADKSKQVGLESEAIVDPMEAEQTWPDEDDLLDRDNKNSIFEEKRRKRRVPEGTSEYQAAWILEDDHAGEEESDYESDAESESDGEGEADAPLDDLSSQGDIHGDNMDTMSSGTQEMDFKDEAVDLEEMERYKEERQETMFPDEVDTPLEQTARERFQKYRGLDSFRTSNWDPKENLPADYARIFHFANLKRSRKMALAQLQENGAAESQGNFVCLHIAALSLEQLEQLKERCNGPMIVYGLLAHEQRMSVVNMVLRKHPSCGQQVSVKSKDRLIFHLGFRRFEANPIFSQHTNGDKHKMERYLSADGGPVVCSVYAPILYGPAQVLVFREKIDGQQELVATGALLGVNPDRLIIKRIILSGHPFKINKKLAVVRYMFFHREDIEWFKPIELRTKCGRRGHIKEALGTHGHMKCLFDGQLNSQDTVLMNLYKRVYPKWTYSPVTTSPKSYTLSRNPSSQHIDMN